MLSFDPETSDMSLFLTLFQRRARKANLPEHKWVTQLLSLMPMKITEMVIWEPESQLENFEYVKEMLLSRFKLSPETFRTNFVSHSRQRQLMEGSSFRVKKLFRRIAFRVRGQNLRIA